MKIKESNACDYDLKIIHDCLNRRDEHAMSSLGRSLCAGGSEDDLCGKFAHSLCNGGLACLAASSERGQAAFTVWPFSH